MKNLKVSMKLIVSFSIVVVLMAVIGVFAIINMTSMDRQSSEMYEMQTQPLTEMGKVIELLQRMRVNLREFALGAALDDQGMITTANERMENYYLIMNENLVNYRGSIDASTEVGRRALELFDEAERLYRNRFLEVLQVAYQMARNGEDAAVIQAKIGEYTDDINKIVDDFDACMTLKLESASSRNRAISDMARNSLIFIIVILAASTAIAVFLTLYISGLISKPLVILSAFMKRAGTTGDLALSSEDTEKINKYAQIKDEIGQTIANASSFISHVTVIAEELKSIAGGDLAVDIEVLSESDTLGVSLLKMEDSLNNMFKDINSASDQVSTGSKQIADGAQLLAQGATEQSATVEQLSASIVEISEQTKNNAYIANEAKELGENIKVSAEQGNRQMEQMMAAVQEINESSKSIGKVIKIIDDIAFQTNILALNAAVEAARAGQHGKGFAVVADEVRSLAAKSAEAAKNTNELIESSIKKAEQGAAISSETAASLETIVQGIIKTSELVSDISKSSNEQSIAINQISDAIGQVSQVVQQNSATAEESAAASEEMSGQSNMLQQLIAQFKLKDSGGMSRHLSPVEMPIRGQSDKPGETGFTLADKYTDFGKY